MLKNIANDLHYKELPRFVFRLTSGAYLRADNQGFWYEMEKLLRRSVHLFSPIELLTLQYAFNHRFPKVGSTDLRKQVEKLILDDFKLLSHEELTLFLLCQSNNAKIEVFDLIEKAFKERVSDMVNVAKEKNPELLVNLFYAYIIGRIPRHRRKTRGIEKDTIKEANSWLSLLDEQIRKDFSKLSTAAVYRLASSLELSGLKDVREMYWR